MKILPSFTSFNISSQGMSVQKKKMNLIAENIANINTTKGKDGTAYKKKFLEIKEEGIGALGAQGPQSTLRLQTTSPDHIAMPAQIQGSSGYAEDGISSTVLEDSAPGERVYMPDHPDADKDGYVQMPNVNVVNEMVDMIAASRTHEANLTAFNSAKQMAKDALEI